MSFGFAVGDFITVADRAVVIYRKCKAAPDDYASLTHHVHTLATVLEDTRSFLDAEVPSSPLRLEALVSAREGCRTTLNEVEAFLDKHVDVTKTKNRNYIRIAKFIAKDLDGLKLKLWSNTNLLQLSLASLTNLSLIGVQTALDLILQEYRNGRRPPSVLSTAILDDQPANVDDLRSQLSMDLEEKDIHPEAISLNQKFIDSWLDDAQGNSSLDESVSDDEDFIPRSPNIDGAFGDPALSTQGLTSPNHVRAKTSVLKESQRPNFNFVSSKQVVVPPQDDTKPIPSLPSLPSPSENLREELKRPNEPELAYEILRPLLRIKYPIDTASVNAGLAHRISQAFNQQDSDHYGLIARPDVWSVSQLLLQASPCGLWATRSSEEWRAWTFLFDSDRDGQYSADEYDSLIRGIISTATEQRNLHKQKSRKRLKKEVTARREFSTDHLPWKCPHDDQTPVLGSELVTGNIKVSSQHLSNFSFTAMAVAADQICNEMHRFEKTWLVGIPVSLHSRLARSLQTARNAALKYAVLEHQLGVQFLGDLDIALIYGCIAFNLPSPLEQYERKSLDLIRALHASFQVMCTLQVFRERLQKIHKRLKKEQVKEGSYEEALETEWENQALQPCAEMIARDMELWNDEVYNRIRTFRLDRSLGMERECATRAIKCYNERYDAKFSFSAFSGKLFEKESDPGTEGMPELSMKNIPS
ncbi:hypothetical protein EJ04DRAFT_529083 [Polyplosphaeria fusca]|uniref:Uncharacterized protein n=1 Tax=Polyplosphaeria fusca TaxID=682080 RepID=A0A9P4QMV3_9PLEO|nr:hypothetical protein EJ04DRAFT_529083 [Polyplosphaeria fusca]